MNETLKTEFDVLPEFKKVWPAIIDDFANVYKPEDYASPFLSFVDMVMVKCKENDDSEYKLFEYIDCINFYLNKEKKSKIVEILIEDGKDFCEEE